LDFKKAFDTIKHESIWNSLEEQGVPYTYIDTLQKLYTGQAAAVQCDAKSKSFDIKRGTKQGDPISPILFNAVVESFMRKLIIKWDKKKFGARLGTLSTSSLTNLRFADDILLVGRTLPQIKSMIADVAEEAAKVGLELHSGKTKILHNGIGYGAGVAQAVCNGMHIEVLDCQEHAMYLGKALRLKEMHDEELRNRMAKAWGKFSMFRNELTDKSIPIKHRMRLFDSVVTPTALYCSGCWAMTIERERKLRTTQRRMMRMILGSGRRPKSEAAETDQDQVETYVEWIQRATRQAEQIMHTYGVADWVYHQRNRLWKWAAKVARLQDSRWSHEILFWSPEGWRPQGRPRVRWTDQLTYFLRQQLGHEVGATDWIQLARNETLWNQWEPDFCKIIAEPF
jgi:hypothetical protein